MERPDFEDILKELSTAVISVHASDLCASSHDASEGRETHERTGITVLVPHSSDGANSLWDAQRIPGIKKIKVGNSQQESVASIESLISRHGVQDKVTAVCEKPNMLMYSHHKHKDRFDVVDLDIADVTQYLDTAVQCVNDGGLLLVTCRDVSLGSGADTDASYAKYGSLVLASDCAEEMALRVLVKCVESHANRHMHYTEPVLCVSLGGGCVKVCVRVFTSPIVCKQTLSKLSMVYRCTGCSTLTLHPLGLAEQHTENKKRFKFSLPRGPPVGVRCENCQAEHKMGGPVWHAPLHGPSFVAKLCQFLEKSSSSERLQQLVTTIRDELQDVCFYYSLHSLHSVVPTEPAITMENLRSALHKFQVSSFHGSEDAVKTDAPANVIWDAITNWMHQENVTALPLKEPGQHILDRYRVKGTSTEGS